MLAQQLSEGADFTIVSDDTDLDHSVNLLNSQRHTAQRQGKVKAVKAPRKTTDSDVLPEIMVGVRSYCVSTSLPRVPVDRPQ